MERDRQSGKEIITKIAVVTYISFPVCLRCVVQMFMNQYRLVVCCVHLKTYVLHVQSEVAILHPSIAMFSQSLKYPMSEKPDPYDIPEQLHQNRSVINDFRQRESIFICQLVVGEKLDTGREPPVWFPWKQ